MVALERMIAINIRKSKLSDMEQMLRVYDSAKEKMRLSGNSNQWINGYPSSELLLDDIEKGNSYVMEQNGVVCGVFAFIIGEDPTYAVIENGRWINDEPYGTIHRIAGDWTVKGVLKESLDFCKMLIPNIRIDTHHDNVIMQHLLDKYGFEKCGIIYLEDGSPRIAYQKLF